MDKLNIKELRSLGITTLRLDFGYSAQEIADLSNNNIKLQFNASTITAEFRRIKLIILILSKLTLCIIFILVKVLV